MTEAVNKRPRPRMVAALMETFGLSLAAAFIVAALIFLAGAAALVWVVLSAPPKSITVSTGPEGSSFYRYAERYQKALKDKKVGLELKLVPSGGSLENLQRLNDPTGGIDLAFVQGGLLEGPKPKRLISLGSVSYQPVWIYYRSEKPLARLSEFAGKRIAIGKVGSGTRALALTLLYANGVTADKATFVEDDAATAAKALIEGRLDAVFLMGEAAPQQTLKDMARQPGIRLYDFTQADAYVRRYTYLNRIRVPQGSFDFAQNLPPQDVMLVGPTVELVARKDLNPGIIEALIDAAQDVHGNANFLQRQGEFPAALKHEFTITDETVRYYRTGRGRLSEILPNIWARSLLNRVLVAFVPFLLVMIPIVRFLPMLYRLRNALRIYRIYRPLLQMERELAASPTRDRIRELMAQLDEIEHNVDRLKVPASFGDQFYELRTHILFVRTRLKNAALGSDARA